MKIWQEFGSSHSSNITIIGKFKDAKVAQEAYDLVEDFINASWAEGYKDLAAFLNAWKDRETVLQVFQPSEDDFELGLDGDPELTRDENSVVISRFRSPNIGGIIKLMFAKESEEISIKGRCLY